MALNRKSGGQFDFDVSYLSQSPCKFCKNHNKLSLCFKDCEMLEKIQRRLANGICRSHSISFDETHSVLLSIDENC